LGVFRGGEGRWWVRGRHEDEWVGRGGSEGGVESVVAVVLSKGVRVGARL
jgi:hypothetical protein